MCHLLLGLPLLALSLFWLLPLPAAIPAYATVAGVSLALYVWVFRAMRWPRVNGGEAMLGAVGRVAGIDERGVTLQLRGELWSADAEGKGWSVGDDALVVGIDGLRLQARKRLAS